jgi:hypothetical protein
MSRMINAPNPGEILADTVLRADGGISVTEFAATLKMTTAPISRGQWKGWYKSAAYSHTGFSAASLAIRSCFVDTLSGF